MLNIDAFDELDVIKTLKKVLNPREQKIVILHSVAGYSLKEIGKEFSISRERVRQIEMGAFRKLRLRYDAPRGKGI